MIPGCTMVEAEVWVCHVSVRASWFGRCFVHGWVGGWHHNRTDAVRDAEQHYRRMHG